MKEYKELSVLVVDNDKLSLFITQRLLKNLGLLNISTVDSGEQAIEACRENKFDIIFMDIKMPILSGIEAMNIIKKFQPGVSFIAHTACYESSFDRSGFDDIIIKPTMIQDLKRVLDNAFQIAPQKAIN